MSFVTDVREELVVISYHQLVRMRSKIFPMFPNFVEESEFGDSVRSKRGDYKKRPGIGSDTYRRSSYQLNCSSSTEESDEETGAIRSVRSNKRKSRFDTVFVKNQF